MIRVLRRGRHGVVQRLVRGGVSRRCGLGAAGVSIRAHNPVALGTKLARDACFACVVGQCQQTDFTTATAATATATATAGWRSGAGSNDEAAPSAAAATATATAAATGCYALHVLWVQKQARGPKPAVWVRGARLVGVGERARAWRLGAVGEEFAPHPHRRTSAVAVASAGGYSRCRGTNSRHGASGGGGVHRRRIGGRLCQSLPLLTQHNLLAQWCSCGCIVVSMAGTTRRVRAGAGAGAGAYACSRDRSCGRSVVTGALFGFADNNRRPFGWQHKNAHNNRHTGEAREAHARVHECTHRCARQPSPHGTAATGELLV